MTRQHRGIGFALALDAQDPMQAEHELIEQLVGHMVEDMIVAIPDTDLALVTPEKLAEMVGNQVIQAISIGFRVGRSWQTKYEAMQREHAMSHGPNN